MEETYKGYKIKYSELGGTFTAHIGESEYSNLSLEKVKKYIDNLERKDFKRTNVIFTAWSDEYKFGIVTSEVPEGTCYGSYDEVWISYKDKHDGSRTKQSIKNVFLDNAHNKAILDQIIQKRKEIEILRLDITKCHSEFERYKLSQ